MRLARVGPTVLVGVVTVLACAAASPHVRWLMAAAGAVAVGLSALSVATSAGVAASARLALMAEQRFLRQIIDIDPNFLFAKDRRGRFTLVNQAVAAAYGTSIENLIGKSDADFNANADEVEFFRRIDRQVLESGRPLMIPEERITDASGNVRWLQTVKCPIFGEDGRVEQVLGVSTDVTERKRIEVALRAEGVRVRAMQRVTAGLSAAATAKDVARIVTTEGSHVVGAQAGSVGVLAADGASFELLAMTGVADELHQQWRRFPNRRGLPFPEVVASGDPIFITTRAEYVARFPTLAQTLEANPSLSAAAILPLMVEGRALGGLGFDFTAPRNFDDGDVALLTTLARQCAQALERARLFEAERTARNDAERVRQRADEANQAKSAFLATMSHELRTPLNAIAGYVELLEMGIRGPVTDTQREDLGRIRRAGEYLLGLINDVLNFVQLESAGVRYALRDVPVDRALREAASLIEPQARRKGVVFSREPCDPVLTVRADPDKVQQVILNLLSNAVKFTPEGGHTTLRCRVHDGLVDMIVQDTGRGIPHDKLDQIFEPFVQVGRELRNPSTGVGLGLAISRELARGMGGELTAASELGSGSTFTFTLPA